MISLKTLIEAGAREKTYGKNDFVFRQEENARYYYQIVAGEVKMCNYNKEGKEFIQGIFYAGQSFGKASLFGHFTYPAHAIAITDVTLLMLPRENFYQLLRDNPDLHFMLSEELADRLHYKSILVREISQEDASHCILHMLEYLKSQVNGLTEKFAYEVNLTRQQIADLTGLRVETTIRAIKKLEKDRMIRIDKRKIMV